MQPNKPPFSYSKKPVRKVRLLKIGPQKSKSLFEEYFRGLTVAISLTVMILGKAGGLGGFDAIVTGLWVGGILWFGWQLRNYRKERAIAGSIEKSRPAMQAPIQMTNQPLPANMKPMIGPQWPVKSLPGTARAWPVQSPAKPKPQESKNPAPAPAPAGTAPVAPSNPNKPAFVYQRPTLPDRKAKLPANWAGKPDKKPKQ